MKEAGSLFARLRELAFFERHWQKAPLLVRGAIRELPQTSLPQLAELATRAGVSSRLVTSPALGAGWSTRRGPFAADDFAGLGAARWTLLVQEVDRHLPSFTALLEEFRFVPNWRIDDVMVSYAADGGGVGPHRDSYDVFLLQLNGRRRWRISSRPLDPGRPVVAGEPPGLGTFEPDEEWLLEPADMLYLPPRVAHEGTAIGACMTCSIGFRVPDPRELCAGFLRQLGPEVFEAIRYADPELERPESLGEIPARAREKLRQAAAGLFTQGGEFDRWLARFATQPLRSFAAGEQPRLGSLEQLREQLESGAILERSSPAHFAWFRDADDSVQLCVGGEIYELGTAGEQPAELVCGQQPLSYATLRPFMSGARFFGMIVDVILRGFLSLRRPG